MRKTTRLLVVAMMVSSVFAMGMVGSASAQQANDEVSVGDLADDGTVTAEEVGLAQNESFVTVDVDVIHEGNKTFVHVFVEVGDSTVVDVNVRVGPRMAEYIERRAE
ncbi:MAG: hypothetical protein SXQ77_06755 [Halobacteria archaeon]|nr:hypothetical protein [Halobacteria archaeon]